jgi:catechol 2,3-dioxygenase-like lactoylglutathione lyase family enzyme
MLGNHDIMAFVATTLADRTRDFYERALGLKFIEDSPFALVFDANGIMLRVQKVKEFQPTSHTALGWNVPDIRAAVEGLMSRGVRFERYEGVAQDDLGVWSAPGGAQVTWFKDPSGNILSLTQFPSR